MSGVSSFPLHIVLTACAFLGLLAGPVRAQTLDQSYDPGTNPMTVSAINGTTPGVEVAQTFTAGISGPLSRVEVYVSQNAVSAPTGNLIMDIRPTDAAGVPDGGVTPTGVLASAAIAAAPIPVSPTRVWATFNFATPAMVVAGQKYAIVLRADNGAVLGWWGHSVPADPYPGGSMFDRTLPMFPNWRALLPSSDLSLKTYVGAATAGVTVTQSGGATNVTEGGATDTYTVVLSNPPTASVTITLTPGAQLSVAPPTLTFTPANFNVAQTVTVTAVDDATVEGPHTGTITHAATSSDTAYNGIAITNVVANITDNDSGPPLPPPPPPPPPTTGGEGSFSGAGFLGDRMAAYRAPNRSPTGSAILEGPTLLGLDHRVRNVAACAQPTVEEDVGADHGWGLPGWILLTVGLGAAVFVRRAGYI